MTDLSAVYTVLALLSVGYFISRTLLKTPAYKEKSFPVYGPLEIAFTTYAVTTQGWLHRLALTLRRRNGSVFGFTSHHHILIDTPGVERFLTQGGNVLAGEPRDWTMGWRVFGLDKNIVIREQLGLGYKKLLAAVEKNYVNEANATAALERADIPAHTVDFVSFRGHGEKEQKMWEVAAQIKVLKPDAPGSPGAVEANLHSLVRDFGMCIALPQLYGKDFMEREGPQLLADFWYFDNVLFPMVMVGLPTWLPIKPMREGLAARKRSVQRHERLYERIDQFQRGLPVDFGADMSDVGPVPLERSLVYAECGMIPKHRGQIDSSLTWGQNANTQPLVFWLLIFIYNTPGLVDELRQEFAEFVPVDKTASPPKITSLDLRGLSLNCPLFKSTLFETYRLAVDATSIRYINRDTEVTDGDYSQEFKAGSWISAPFGPANKDASLYPNPDKFVPERFLEIDPQTGRKVARYGKMKPWGAGAGICKGRTFAERELLGVAASVMSLWEVEPASGTWKVPGMRPGTGTTCPLEDVRVKIKRRTFA